MRDPKSTPNMNLAKPEKKTEGGTIQWRLQEWFKSLSVEQLNSLKKFHEILIKYNEAISLVSPKTIFNADNVHFADCILANNLIFADHKMDEVFDFGAGNGFPSVVFAIFNPGINFKAVEIDQRKCEFIKIAKSTVGLKNLEVLNQQVESLPTGKVRFAVSRAFAPMAKALMITRKVFAQDGLFYHMKSEEWANEVSSLPSQLCTHWTPSLVSEYKLPVGEIKYAVVKTIKVSGADEH